MKNKLAVILLSVSMAVISLNGCGKSDKQEDKNITREWENENAVHGEVSKVTEDTIIIKVADGNMASMADSELTGEEQEITVTKDTVIRRTNMRGLPENGDVPQTPDGRQGIEDSEMPEKPDSRQGIEDSEMPEKPDSRQEMKEGEMPSEPDGKAPAGEMPDKEESSEEITISDISVGDIVMVIFTDDNSAAEITVMPSKRDGEKSEPSKSKESEQKDTTV